MLQIDLITLIQRKGIWYWYVSFIFTVVNTMVKSKRWAGWGMWHNGGEEKWIWGFSGETWRKEIKRIRLKLIVNKYDGSAWNGLIWLRTGTSSRLFWTEWWPFRIYKMWGMTWPTELLKNDSASWRWLVVSIKVNVCGKWHSKSWLDVKYDADMRLRVSRVSDDL